MAWKRLLKFRTKGQQTQQNHQQQQQEEESQLLSNTTMSTPLTENPISPMPASQRQDHDEFDENPSNEEGSEYSDESSYEDDDDDDDDDDDAPLSLQELLYSASSFHAIARPVSITMILAALAAVYVNNDATLEMGAQQFATAYQVWSLDDGDDSSTGKNLAMSIANTLVMVCAIAAMTFGIVLLYKYRCMKFLIGYMMFSSASLLGILGDYMATIAIEIYRIPIDVISYYGSMYNFAIVGVISIFYQKGIPSTITQMYLVFTSVILAWHLSHFDEWTAWTLLVMLALYDLCAVLTPCGPLKALVNLMQEEDSPEMPGLLYEAQLPAGTHRPGGGGGGGGTSARNRNRPTSSNETNINSNGLPSTTATTNTTTNAENSLPSSSNNDGANTEMQRGRSRESRQKSNTNERSNTTPEASSPSTSYSPTRTSTDASPLTDHEIVVVPLAIAKVYRLKLVSTYGTSSNGGGGSNSRRRRRNNNRGRNRNSGTNDDASAVNPSPLLADWEQATTPVEFYDREFTAGELTSDVEVELPRNGGRIEKKVGGVRRGERKFEVFGRNGELKRTLMVDDQGVVYEISANSFDDDDDDSAMEESSSIRLGLGDFIFYSVLVAKAALYSFTTFAACFLVIMAGLGGTLVILSVYRSALPALPISIFLGVIFYLLTRLIIEPWIEIIFKAPIYV